MWFWNAADLEHKLAAFDCDYNQARVHKGLNGNAPDEVAGAQTMQQASLSGSAWESHGNGLFELPIAA